jgi:hypothetical protein
MIKLLTLSLICLAAFDTCTAEVANKDADKALKIGTDIAVGVACTVATAEVPAGGLITPICTILGTKALLAAEKALATGIHRANCKDQVFGWSWGCSKISKKEMLKRISRCSSDKGFSNGVYLTQNCKRGFLTRYKDCWFADDKGNVVFYEDDPKNFNKYTKKMKYVRCKNWRKNK